MRASCLGQERDLAALPASQHEEHQGARVCDRLTYPGPGRADARRAAPAGAALAGALVKGSPRRRLITFERPRAGLPRSPAIASNDRQSLQSCHFSARRSTRARARGAATGDSGPACHLMGTCRRQRAKVRSLQRPTSLREDASSVGRDQRRSRTLNSPPSPLGLAPGPADTLPSSASRFSQPRSAPPRDARGLFSACQQ